MSDPAAMNADEDLIESEAPSPRTTEIRRRFESLVPATVGRKVLGGITAAALALGLVAGFLVGNVPGTEPTVPSEVQEGPPPDGGYIPIVPDGSPLEPQVALAVGAGSLTIADLAGLGETVLSESLEFGAVSGLDGLCGIVSTPESVQLPQGPGVAYVLGSASFRLVSATLRQRIGPDLDVLAASTLRGTVELARSCSSGDGLTAGTEGIQTGIGDEYAVFTVSRPDPSSGEIETSIVILIRVGGRLIELALSPEGPAEVPAGLARALAIAEVAVTRMLAG